MINQVYIKSVHYFVCLNFLALCTWTILWIFLIKTHLQLWYFIVSCIWTGRVRGGEDAELEGKKLMKLWRTNGGEKNPERARAEEEEEMRRIRWGGGGQEALSSQPAGWGEKEWRERESRRRRGGRSKKKKLERLWVCVRAKWGLYKWKQMPGIMNLSGRRWGWRWWSTWLPGWLSFTLLLLPLNCLPQCSEGEREKEGETEWVIKQKRRR